MALLSTIKLEAFGVEVIVPDVYIKVDKIRGDKTEIIIDITYYKDSTKENVVIQKVFSFVPTLTGDNFIIQGYDYLKTLSEFADAIDC